MKKSFILYMDSLKIADKLTDKQLGKFFRAIIKYQKKEEYILPIELDLVFDLFKNQFERDEEKYEKFCESQKVNGKKGGRPKGKKPNKPMGLSDNPINPTVIPETQKSLTDTDTDNVNDNDNDIYTHWNNKNIIHCQKLTGEIKTEIKKILKILTIEQVKKAIDIYSEVVLSEKTFFNYKWSLLEFLQRKNGCRVWHERVFDNYLKDINNINDQYRTIEI